MNTLEKAKIWLKQNKIKYEYENDKKYYIEEIKVWTASNCYYWIYRHTRIWGHDWEPNKKQIIRTNIVDVCFDIERFRPSGTSYMGSSSRKVSFERMKRELKDHFKRYKQ